MTDIENILQTLTYAEKEYRRQKTELEIKPTNYYSLLRGIKSTRKEKRKAYKKYPMIL